MNTRTKLLVVLLAAAAGLFALAWSPGSAAAATQTLSPSFTGSGNDTSVLSALAVCDECAPDAFFTDPNGVLQTWGLGAEATLQAKASWANPATVALNYTAGNLRHGKTLDLADTLTIGSGTVTLDYSVSATLGVFGTPQTGSLSCAVLTVSPTTCNGWVATTDTTTVGPITASDTIPCDLPLPGDSPRTCSKTKTVNLWSGDLFGIASASVDLVIDESIQVTSAGVGTVRLAVVSGGSPIAPRTISFAGSSPSTVSDPIAIDCSQPVGNDLVYSLTSIGATADPATYTGDVKLQLSAEVLGIGTSYTSPALLSTSGANLGPIALGAPDQQVDLGPVLPNNVAPSPDAGGPYSGVEGTPVQFDGSGSTGVCGPGTLVWHFSDGGVAYGISPQHTFHGPGVYSGLLESTDADGNTASTTFTVTIANLPPVASAGPDMSSEWGVPVTLNGSAVDPGSDEQPFLTYSWDFGDGTPSASGGASVNHSYANPGTYVATFTACDPYGACGVSTAQVVVVQRTSTLTYTGANQSNPSKTVTFSASLVDDLGQPVAGRVVTFVLNDQTISATTDSSGNAAATIKVKQKQGLYTVSATFAGDAKYVGSADSRDYQVGP